MKILVVGCGKIGTNIVHSLVAEGHDVTVIDSDPEVLEEVTNIHDVIGVCGNGADWETLEEAGVSKAALVVAVTGTDEQNMLACFMAKKLGAKYTVARIRNPEYNDRSLEFMRQQLGISLAINPDMMAAQALYDLLKFPSAVKVETFSRRNFEMVEIRLKPDSSLDGVALKDLRNKYKAQVLVCIVQRGDDVFIPDGNFVLKGGDLIGITATPSEIQKFLRELGVLQKKANSVMIMGGSRIAYYLAKLMTAAGNAVKIIEKDQVHCEELCDALPKAMVIHGDGAQQELLLEEGLKTLDAFVALTGIDEENILISIFASSQNVPTVISKVNRKEMASLAQKLGLDHVVSPKEIVSDILVRYARALENSMGSNVETLYKLMDGKAEALEFNVHPDCKMIRIPLKDLQFKSNILIAGIIRDRKPIIPGGMDVFLPGDKVIVLAADRRLNDLSDIAK